MKVVRYLLFPISFIYWIVTSLRNLFYNLGVYKSFQIPGKSIVVGNLSAGGTGKSPHVDLIIQLLLSKGKSITTLSRGYGRKTKGYCVAEVTSSSLDVGDEPLMFKVKHGDKINVVVCEDRTIGVKRIQESNPDNEVIILDDAFQHRKVRAGFNILISDFNKPFYNDFLLPVGMLRESRKGARRADVVIVSKSPKDLSTEAKLSIASQCKVEKKNVFFSRIEYGDLIPITAKPIENIKNVLVVTGIANPTPLLNHLREKYEIKHLSFGDHHEFSQGDMDKIREKFDTFVGHEKAIVTTEKDYMRLRKFDAILEGEIKWFYQPIEVVIDRQKEFNAVINNYVGEI